jgi:hypothetical protein
MYTTYQKLSFSLYFFGLDVISIFYISLRGSFFGTSPWRAGEMLDISNLRLTLPVERGQRFAKINQES